MIPADPPASPAPLLGRLEQAGLRPAWTNEATGFTPWLAQDENLPLLAETIRLELELQGQEQAVGPFRANILGRDAATRAPVPIGNQLERTDHGHLGLLLTDASGLDAVIIIWIAGRFHKEHPPAPDWLNRIPSEEIRPSGLENELWHIGTSPVAPRFNVVSRPNDWFRGARARASEGARLPERDPLLLGYWTGLLDLEAGPVRGHLRPQPSSMFSCSIGRLRVWVVARATISKSRLRVELYLAGIWAKSRLFQRLVQRTAIGREPGIPLEWNASPGSLDSDIAISVEGVSIADRLDWPRQHAWLARNLNLFPQVFAPRVRALVDDTTTPGDEDNTGPASGVPDGLTCPAHQ